MKVYYNEVDAYCCAWLSNLMDAGHISPGRIDDRSIVDVPPDELLGYDRAHFFAGIGIWEYAVRRSGLADFKGRLWTGSCPCQPFSAAGAGAGFDDERHLWPHWHWLQQHVRPEIVLGEQVAGKDGLGWYDLVSDDLAGIGYTAGAVNICAAGFGVDWRGSAESQRLERAIRHCPDPLVARHMAAFADWADQSLGIGGFHIRQRLYFVGLADEPSGGFGEQRDALEQGQGGHADGSGDAHGRLADPAGVGSGAGLRSSGSAEHGRPVAADDGAAGGVLDPERTRLEGFGGDGDHGHEPGRHRAHATGPAASPSSFDGVVDLDGDRLNAGHTGDGRAAEGARGQDGSGDARPGRNGGLDHVVGERRSTGRDGDHRGDVGQQLAATVAGSPRPGANDGGRGNADWLLCRDGVWRAVGPGTFPLVDATPARVGRLRSYGNGLDAETATRFCETVIDMLKEMGRW